MNGLRVHVSRPGSSLRKQGNRVVVTTHAGERLGSYPLGLLTQVVVHSSAKVTSSCHRALLGNGVELVYLDSRGRVTGRLTSEVPLSTPARLAQLGLVGDIDERLSRSRILVAAKIRSQTTLSSRRCRSAKVANEVRHPLSHLLKKTAQAGSINELLGLEGAASAHTYRMLFATLPARVDPDVTRRNRRSHDVINAAINYASALLRERVLQSVLLEGLDPQLSVLHEPARGRPTLAFDLMEPFRPALVEGIVFPLAALGAITPRHVNDHGDGPRLDRAARQKLIEAFERRLDDELGVEIDRQSRSYRRALAGGSTLEPFVWRRR